MKDNAGFYPEIVDVKQQLVIDAAVPKNCSPPKSHGAHDAFDLVVINANPFLFKYTVNFASQPVIETAPAFFFQQLLGVDFSSLAPAIEHGLADTSEQKSVPQLPLPVTCAESATTPQAYDVVVQYWQAARRAANIIDLLHQTDRAISNDLSSYNEAWNTVTNPRAIIADVVPAARIAETAETSIGSTLDQATAILDGSVADFIGRARLYLKYIDGAKLSPDLRHCAFIDFDGSTSDVASLVARSDIIANDTIALPKKIATLHTTASSANTNAKHIRDLLAEPLNFYIIRRVGGHSTAARDSIAVIRQPASAGSSATDSKSPPAANGSATAGANSLSIETHPVAAPIVQFGPRKFLSIGAGLSLTDLPARQFGVVKQYQPTAGADSVVSVIGVNQNDTRRLAPMLTLNGHLTPGACSLFGLRHARETQPPYCDVLSGISAVLGATVSRTGSTNLEYFAGLGLDLFDDRLTFAGGYYTGQTQRLADGYSVGQRLPAGQPSVPTVTHTLWRPAIQCSFRIY